MATAHLDRLNRSDGALIGIAHAYQRALLTDPRNASALVGMSVVALASRQHAAAISMASAAVEAEPGRVVAWVALGQAFKAMDRTDEAEQAYVRALALDGMNELARLGLGELKLATGGPDAAIFQFRRALDRRPALAGALMGLGHALAMLERFDQALEQYENVLALKPRLPEAHFAAGFVLNRLGRFKEAEARYRRALVERPDFAAAWLNLGHMLRDQGREAYAEAALLRAVELRPDMIAGWIALGLLERERRRPAHAEQYLRRAFSLNPEQVETRIAWCQFRASEKDSAGAWGWLRWALARAPNHAEANNMQGILLHNDRRFEEAVAAFERAETLGHRAAVSNRGNTLLDLGRMEDALAAQERAVELDPSHPGAHYNLALTRLRQGDWECGWPEYEARWHFREVHRSPRVFQQPRWRGEAIAGRCILLHGEQGLGDTIQFCRYATMVAARGAFVILQVQPAVERLLGTLGVVRSGQATIVAPGAKSPAFDLECPLMSLPAVFRTTIETTPWTGAYLTAEHRQEKTKCLHANVELDDARESSPLQVGIAWAGNPRYKGDRERSMDLAQFLPLLGEPGVLWVSLQKGTAAEQIAALPKHVAIADGSSRDHDLADTAALISTLDLIVTTDTCIAHLAGAMAKPVWILLPWLSDWRWMQQIETSPWYPTARLLRQQTPGDWPGVMARAREDLKRFRDFRGR